MAGLFHALLGSFLVSPLCSFSQLKLLQRTNPIVETKTFIIYVQTKFQNKLILRNRGSKDEKTFPESNHRRRLSCFTLQLSDMPSIAAFCACFAVVCLLLDPSLNILGSIQISSIGCKDCHYRQDVSPFHLFEVAF